MAAKKRPATKSKYKPLSKSRSNTSGKPSAAKKLSAKKKPVKKTKSKAPKNAKISNNRPDYMYKLNKFTANNPPRQLPETKLTEKGLTLRQLLRYTPALMLNNALDVHLITLKKTKTNSGMPAIQAETYSTDDYRPNKVKRKHRTFIIGAEQSAGAVDKPVNKHRKVLVSCTCENAVYTWEYANAAHGAGRIIYCNGDPPVMTNPGIIPGLCKHLVELARTIIKKEM